MGLGRLRIFHAGMAPVLVGLVLDFQVRGRQGCADLSLWRKNGVVQCELTKTTRLARPSRLRSFTFPRRGGYRFPSAEGDRNPEAASGAEQDFRIRKEKN